MTELYQHIFRSK